MKKINIISEAIYKGQIKQVNQGSFVNLTNIVNDIFTCFGIPCCENKADFFIRKTYLLRGRKKPGPNWWSLNKLVLDVYNCCAGTTLCQDTGSLQWWITTDVIRPKQTIETINFTNIIKNIFACCNLTTCGCGSTYNFDLEMDWSILKDSVGNPYSVTDQSTFTQWLTNGMDSLGDANNDFTNIIITDFVKTGNRIQCNLTADCTKIALQNNTIVSVTKLGVLNGLDKLFLYNNQITTFNPSIALPSTLTQLQLQNNQIVTFNPTLPLPAGLIELNLAGNQIVTFNPTLPLPSTLEVLELGGNNIVIFNPTNSLPISLTGFSLDNNQMTTAGYTSSEPWANSQPAFSSNCNINFGSNINSVTGTNLETILLTKNCTIFP